MTEEEILKQKQEEEVKPEDIDETLPSSEAEEQASEVEEEASVPELNSSSEPTLEQTEAASLDPVEPEAGAQGGDCADCSASSESVESPESGMTEEQKAVEKMLSQSQVNEIVGRTRTETRDGTLKSVWDRYGVSDESGMDEMAGRSQKYDLLREDYDHLAKELQDVKVRLAMYDSGIAPERYEDARLILTGKGLDVTAENIASELATHPEWKKTLPTPNAVGDEISETFVKAEKPEPVSVISKLGNESPREQGESESERSSAMKMFR